MKKGFTMFKNEIFEAVIGAKLNATEFKVLLIIIRYTAGFNRDNCNITLNYIVKLCKKSKNSVINAIKNLCDEKLITKEKIKDKNSFTYSVNEQVILEKYGPENCNFTVQKTAPSMVQKTAPYKYNNINKNNIYNVPTPKATSFSNFTPRENTDYRKIEMEALRKKMEKVL